MKLKINGGDLKDVIDSLQGTLNDDAVFKFKEDRILIKSADPGGNMMVAVLIPEDAMDTYDKGNLDKMGFDLETMDNFLASKTKPFSISYDGDKLHYAQDGMKLSTRGIEPDYVEGKVDSTPQLDYAVEFEGDVSWIFDFIKRLDSTVGTDHWFISPRDGAIYVYGEKDDTSMSDFEHWEDFDDYSIDWSKARIPDDVNVPDPEEEHVTTNIYSLNYAKNFNKVSDHATVYLDNHGPIRIVFETDAGVKISTILTPRIPSNDGRATLPDGVAEERGLGI